MSFTFPQRMYRCECGEEFLDGPQSADSTRAYQRALRDTLIAEVERLRALGRSGGAPPKVGFDALHAANAEHTRQIDEFGCDARTIRPTVLLAAYQAERAGREGGDTESLNAEADPNYRPYCLRCRALGRMEKVEPFLWRCACGAEHDERLADPAPEPTPLEINAVNPGPFYTAGGDPPTPDLVRLYAAAYRCDLIEVEAHEEALRAVWRAALREGETKP